MVYRHEGKARVRRVRTPDRLRYGTPGAKDQWVWQAAVPGGTYLYHGGLHFHSWTDAHAYVDEVHRLQRKLGVTP